jgi:mediator of RNA polymerase II transcription subunit 17
MDEPAWKRLKLSVEPPYKDEDGRKILRVYDIEKGNVRILEEFVICCFYSHAGAKIPILSRKKSASTRLRDVLARIALERGPDIASLTIHNLKDDDDERKEPENAVAKDADDEEEQAPMEYDELAKMRETAFQNLECAHFLFLA